MLNQPDTRQIAAKFNIVCTRSAQSIANIFLLLLGISRHERRKRQVEAVQSARLSVDQPGIVNAILVSAGTPVNKGDPLLQIDQRDLALQVARMAQNVTFFI